MGLHPQPAPSLARLQQGALGALPAWSPRSAVGRRGEGRRSKASWALWVQTLGRVLGCQSALSHLLAL